MAELIISLTQKLLDSIAAGDWATYETLCSPDLTCFEPEAAGHLVSGVSLFLPTLKERDAEVAMQGIVI